MLGNLLFPLIWSSILTPVYSRIPTHQGVWTGPTNALPDSKIGDTPLLGNGNLGILFDTHNPPISPPTSTGPGRNETLDMWLSSTNFWSCQGYQGLAKGTCGKIALGGVSISLLPSQGTLVKNAVTMIQDLGSATLYSSFQTQGGGTFNTTTRLHPTLNVLSTTLLYTPGASDPATLPISISTWVLGSSTQHAYPTPSAAQCWDPTTGNSSTPCSNSGGGGVLPLSLAVRNANSKNGTGGSSPPPHPLWAALTSGLVMDGGGMPTPPPTLTPVTPVGAGEPWGVSMDFAIPGGRAFFVLTAEAESPLGSDAAAAAAAHTLAPFLQQQQQEASLLKGSKGCGNGPSAIAAASQAWWEEFWSQSYVDLPTQPALQLLYDGAAYTMGSTASTNPGDAPPALYGVWATSDSCYWNGDYTLDYNSESTFFAIFSQNHGAQFATYASPLLDWATPGLAKAVQEANASGVTCPTTAMNFACHLAPWGYQSDDQSTYMQWNLAFSLLPIMSQWEYTHNATAALTALPLLQGNLDWWGCYLVRGEDGRLHDNSTRNGDEEHENQRVADPIIGLALVLRSAGVLVDIQTTLGLPVSAPALEILQGLAPFPNTTLHTSGNSAFNITPNWRLHNDNGLMAPNPDTAVGCQAACNADGECQCFTWCSHATADCPKVPGPACFNYHNASAAGSVDANFTTGCRIPGNGSDGVLLPVWAAYPGASVAQSDTFALYPDYPSEALGGVLPLGDADRLLAQASYFAYQSGNAGRPLDMFMAGIRSIAGGSAAVLSPKAPTPTQLVAALGGWAQATLRPSGLSVPAGGGVENAGVARALTEMLVASILYVPVGGGGGNGGGGGAQWYASLFAVWPEEDPGEFGGILAKGGCAYGAVKGAQTPTLGPIVNATAVYPSGSGKGSGGTHANCSLQHPWPSQPTSDVGVVCGGAVPVSQWISVVGAGGMSVQVLTFLAPLGVPCTVTLT